VRTVCAVGREVTGNNVDDSMPTLGSGRSDGTKVNNTTDVVGKTHLVNSIDKAPELRKTCVTSVENDDIVFADFVREVLANGFTDKIIHLLALLWCQLLHLREISAMHVS